MEVLSVFMDKAVKPSKKDLPETLGSSYGWWEAIENFVLEKYPDGKSEWNFPGKKYGWSYRIKDKKRAIIYFLPLDQYFKVGFVFGQKAFDQIMESAISDEIKNELREATKYAEGRGIRIDVKDESVLSDIKKLIEIKLKY